MTTPRLEDARWQRLGRRLRSVMAEEVPGWTDQRDADPGVPLLEVFAFLGEQLVFRANAIPDQARTRLFGLAARLESLARGNNDVAATVCIDGEQWRRTEVLAHAGPDDPVFTMTDDGRIAFGDGVHGRQPAPGSDVFASYRGGAGTGGNTRVSVTTRWPMARSRFAVTTDPLLGIAIMPVADLVEQFTGEKRTRYFDGKRLTAEDFRDEQQYWLDKHRSHNQTLHGWGVVSGLGVTVGSSSPRTIVVGPGLAIDARGREVLLREPATLASTATAPLFVIVSYLERCTDSVPAPDASEGTAASRVEEGASVLLAENENATDGVVVGRVLPRAAGWEVDATFVAERVVK